MGGEKQGVWSQLFGNGGSMRRKLGFHQKIIPAETQKEDPRKFDDEKMLLDKLLPILDENRGQDVHTKRSETSSIASSTEVEVVGSKAPGVVARLMGLDSLPSKDVLETNSTRFTVAIHGIPIRNQSNKLDIVSKKSMEMSPQKLQKTCLIEKRPTTQRFQYENMNIPLISRNSQSKHLVRNNQEGNERTQWVSPNSKESDSSSVIGRNRGKSISLAVQAKVNVQRREGLSNGSMVQKALPDESRLNRQLRSQPNVQNTKQKKPVPSSVLKQNNLKQNSSKVSSSKPSITKEHVGLTSDRKNEPRSKSQDRFTNVAKAGIKKASLERSALDKEPASSRDKVSGGKKRQIDGALRAEKRRPGVTVLAEDKRVFRGNLSGRAESEKRNNMWHPDEETISSSSSKCMDVVSFTFSSPMMPMPRPRPYMETTEEHTQIVKDDLIFGSRGEMNFSSAKTRHPSSNHGSRVLGGDALGSLLEQKLKELTSVGVTSSKVSGALATASILQDLIHKLNTQSLATKEEEKKGTVRPQKDNSCRGTSSIESDCWSACGPTSNTKLEFLVPETTRDGKLNATKGRLATLKSMAGDDCDYQSPVSTLEAAFPCDSCNSSESFDSSTLGIKLHPTLLSKTAEPEAEELSDSASSLIPEISNFTPLEIGVKRGQQRVERAELEYVREIISSSDLRSEYLAGSGEFIDPLLFDRLERGNHERGLKQEDRMDSKAAFLHRKVVFDCVGEFVDSKYSRCGKGGYKVWARGLVAISNKHGLVEEACVEISRWKSMGECMVDEIIEKDMSIGLGKWVDFEAERFELGTVVEMDLFQALVDEVVDDILGWPRL